MPAPVPDLSSDGAQRASSRVDGRVLARIRQRVARAPQAPWLHQEAARRMAERLAVMRQPPGRILDVSLDPPDEADPLRQARPDAERALLRQPGSPTPAEPVRPWWQPDWAPWGRGARPVQPMGAEQAQAWGADLLWANMCLHLAEDPVVALRSWRSLVGPTGFLMFTTLGPGSLEDLRALYSDLAWGPPHAAFTDMHDLGDMLVETGWADPVMDQETLTLHYSRPEDLLAELQALGANADPQRVAGLRTPRWRERLLAALEARRNPQGQIVLRWELVYGHAFQAPPRGPAVAPETHIALGDMRRLLRRSGEP